MPGQVKTRLAREVGPEKALAAHQELTTITLKAARRVRGAELVVCFTPAEHEQAMRVWLGDDLRYEAQTGADLGARMAAAIHARLNEGAERVVVIGTDCPGLQSRTIDGAFEALERVQLVVGPATDGGYYLIGMRTDHAELFTGIPWSSDRTLAATLAAARTLGLTMDLLDIMWDVDTGDDFRRWKG